MKKDNTQKNLTIAFGFLVVWGNLISLFLPADQFGTIIKIVDFASVIFLLCVLVTEIVKKNKEKKQGSAVEGEKKNGPSVD